MKTILFILLLASNAIGGDLLQLCIGVSVAQAGAQPDTLALRAALTSPTATAEDRRDASMRLNAIYDAAVASGRMEFLRISAERNAAAREAQEAGMIRQLLLMQSMNFQNYNAFPFYFPR